MSGPDVPEETLRQTACKRLDATELPVVRVEDLGAGPGSGNRCDLCGSTISKDQIEYAVQMGARMMNFHIICFSAWQIECAKRIPR